MKSLTMKLTMAAAALAALVGVSSAQTSRAEIPFAFRAGGAVMAPGTYHITEANSGKVFQLMNTTAGNGMLLLKPPANSPPKAWLADGNPRLVFECGRGRCALVEIWNGQEKTYKFPRPKLGRDEEARRVEVTMKAVTAD
jgi:hypothetical protein